MDAYAIAQLPVRATSLIPVVTPPTSGPVADGRRRLLRALVGPADTCPFRPRHFRRRTRGSRQVSQRAR